MPDARLSVCRTCCGGEAFVFDPEEAVCAVRETGSLTGRVGDFGRGFLNPVWGGDSLILVFGTDPVAAVVVGLRAGFDPSPGANDALAVFFS